jgi:hypothetical protein
MHWSTLLINIYHGCSVEVWPKVWVHKLSRIVTSLKSAVRSSVKLQRTFKSLSNLTACVCQNCKGQQPPPVQLHSFLAVKVTCSMIYMSYNLLSVSGQEVSLVLWPNLSHISELQKICTTRHLHCTLGFSCF